MASVEELKLDGASITLLAVCDGDQASIGLECMKSAFAALTFLSSDVAQRIADAAPPMFAHSAAVVVMRDRTAYVASSGHARVYRQRAHQLEGLPAGAQEVAFSDVLLVASHALRSDGKDFLMTGRAPMAAQAMIRNLGDKGWIELGANTFRNDTLDTLLDQALASSGETEAAVAAICTGFLHVFEVEDAPAENLTPQLIEAALAVSPFAASRLIVRAAEAASDYAALPSAIKELHAVYFVAGEVGRDGASLERAVTRFGPSPNFLAMTLRGLSRIGAVVHHRILREAVPFLVHFNTALEPVMQELALAPVPKSNAWELSNQWGDAPDVLRLAEWHVKHAYSDFLSHAPSAMGATLTPPEALVRSPARSDLITQLTRILGVALTEQSAITFAQAEQVSAALAHHVEGTTVTALLNYIYDEGQAWALLRLVEGPR